MGVSRRVVYVFGGPVAFPVQDVTPTYLTPLVLSTLRQCDHLAQQVLRASGHGASLSQMPVILLPLHLDRDVVSRQPSCQHCVVVRTFITQDFMTGVPATPNKHLPLEVSLPPLCAAICDFLDARVNRAIAATVNCNAAPELPVDVW